MPVFIDPVFANTSPKRSFSMIENERFGLVFAKSGSTNSGTVLSVLPLSPSLWFESDLQTTQYRVPYTVESPLPPANFALAVGAPAPVL